MIQDTFDRIVDEIAFVDPEFARRIIDRMMALDRDREFTFTARPVL